ncbi:TetR family transcriptional regulator [Streptomyces viridiviolaceus]|uniref:TetR/AcrR family transcriptional regulator n=1 Tax=Streptomyces viridiviolaceus TaxID=68282 RepID=A0ABW2E5J4_9ACTN|nr:TetR family transcriptional regulator [Streptomyces viridiviolaceus]GHB70098.1 TetR family transcriptional regulator [Streptomyces viridiviolaceus]
MGRVSQAQAEENRRRVVDTASRLFREQGTQVSVADLMKAAGLTHGAFYKQFASKEALVDEATAHAFAELARRHAAGLERYDGQRDAAQRALIDAYLSVEHRDNAADGCPVSALAVDIARQDEGSEARRRYAEGVADFAAFLGPAETAAGDGDRAADKNGDGIVRLCTLFGALVLARATKGSPLSEEILTAAHAALTKIS